MEIQNLERRNSEYALFESQRELESQRQQSLKANQWADQAQRQRIHLCSELEVKNRLHQECSARSCQEIEELKRRCYKDENEVTQQKMNEYTMQHDQETRRMSLLRDQVRKLQERLEFIEVSKIFQDPDSPSSFGSAHVSHQALITRSSRKPSRESRTHRNTRENMSIPGNVFDRQPARRVPEELHNDSRNLATSSGIQRREGIEKSGSEEPLQPKPLPCFSGRAREKKLDDRNRLMSMTNSAAGIGTCTQSGMTIPSFPSSEMHLCRFPDQTEFQSWIVNFQAGVCFQSGTVNSEVCSKAKNPTLALQWTKEIEAAKSLDDLITPKSITGNDFPNYEEDLMMATALKRCYDKQTHFRKKISVEEQRAQKDRRFVRGRQIAYLIHEYLRPAGSNQIQGLSGLFSNELDNDYIQDFDLRWEQALSLTSDPSSEKV